VVENFVWTFIARMDYSILSEWIFKLDFSVGFDKNVDKEKSKELEKNEGHKKDLQLRW
jgi:hypothetical protein